MQSKSTTLKVGIIAYENCTSSMILGMMDILSLANAQWPHFRASSSASEHPLFNIEIITLSGKPVMSFNQYPITPHASAKQPSKYDIIYVPGFLGDPEQVIRQQREVIVWLKQQYASGRKLIAACNGNLLLAETGLLDGKKATTHWSLVHFFENRYTHIVLKPEKIIVDEGDIISAAGVSAYMNLAIYLVAKYGSPELASHCSKIFLVDAGRKVQAPYFVFTSPKSHGDEEVVKIQDWLETNFKKPVSIDTMAKTFNLSRRTLSRRFKMATGDSPLEYLQRLRIENAKRLLESSSRTFSEITWQVGYNDISSFQRLFSKSTGLSPSAYRRKFSMIEV